MEILGAALVVSALIIWLSVILPARTGGVVINVITQKERPIGPGFNFPVWRPLERKVRDDISLKTNTHLFKFEVETDNEAVIPLSITIQEAADLRYLPEYNSFENQEDRVEGIKEKIKFILSVAARKMKDRDAVHNKIKFLQRLAKRKFEASLSEDGRLLEQYYGTNLQSVVIGDSELAQTIREAQEKKEAQEKENERRKLDMDNLKKMASALVTEAKEKHDQKLSFDVALRKIQIQLEKKGVQENFNTLGIEQGTQELIDSVLKEVLRGKRRKQG